MPLRASIGVGFMAVACVLVPAMARAQAQTTTGSSREISDYPIFVACANGGAGEQVQVQGVSHYLLHWTTDGRFVSTSKELGHYQNVTGVGLLTGDRYRVTGGTQFVDRFEVLWESIVLTVTSSMHFIGQGALADFRVHYLLHLTVDANGNVTSEVVNVAATCT